MAAEEERDAVALALRRINEAWLHGNIEDMIPVVHEQVVMVFPGFSARSQGRENFLAGFRDFCQSASIHAFQEHDRQIDIAGDVAVATFRYEMLYERSGKRFRSTGRDLWVFQSRDGAWIAAWRTMLDIDENTI